MSYNVLDSISSGVEIGVGPLPPGIMAVVFSLLAPLASVSQAPPVTAGQVGVEPAPASPRIGDAVVLDIMTFNIRTAGGRDGENSWPRRRERVAEAIRRFSPDVLGLQEALTVQIEFLEAELPGYRWLGVDRGLNGGRGLSEATPIFYRSRELVPIESGTFWLAGDPDRPGGGGSRDSDDRSGRRRRGGRIVTWARFHHLETGREVHVFNTHFTLRRGRRQLEAMARINARIRDLPPGSPVVVMGDFNAVAESSDTWEVATGEGLRDAWTVAEERVGPALTSAGFGPPPPGREGRIDWVLVGGPIEVPRIETVVDGSDGRYPSDHYPVFVTLEIGREGN